MLREGVLTAQGPNWGAFEHRQGWKGAVSLLRYLLEGNPLQPLPFSSLVLAVDERPLTETAVEYARFYAVNVQYAKNSTFAIGSVPFVIGAVAANTVGNAVARNRARAMAAPQWREVQISAS